MSRVQHRVVFAGHFDVPVRRARKLIPALQFMLEIRLLRTPERIGIEHSDGVNATGRGVCLPNVGQGQRQCCPGLEPWKIQIQFFQTFFGGDLEQVVARVLVRLYGA